MSKNPFVGGKEKNTIANISKNSSTSLSAPPPAGGVAYNPPLKSFSINNLVLAGETEARPKDPAIGALFINSELGYSEVWNGDEWVNLGDIAKALRSTNSKNRRREAIRAQQRALGEPISK